MLKNPSLNLDADVRDLSWSAPSLSSLTGQNYPKKVKSKKALILVSLCFSMVNVKLDLFKVAPMATNPQFPTATIPHDRARIGQRAHCRAASKLVGK